MTSPTRKRSPRSTSVRHARVRSRPRASLTHPSATVCPVPFIAPATFGPRPSSQSGAPSSPSLLRFPASFRVCCDESAHSPLISPSSSRIHIAQELKRGPLRSRPSPDATIGHHHQRMGSSPNLRRRRPTPTHPRPSLRQSNSLYTALPVHHPPLQPTAGSKDGAALCGSPRVRVPLEDDVRPRRAMTCRRWWLAMVSNPLYSCLTWNIIFLRFYKLCDERVWTETTDELVCTKHWSQCATWCG